MMENYNKKYTFSFNEDDSKTLTNKQRSTLWKMLYVFFYEMKRGMDQYLKYKNRDTDNITQEDLIFLLKYIVNGLNNITKNYIK